MPIELRETEGVKIGLGYQKPLYHQPIFREKPHTAIPIIPFPKLWNTRMRPALYVKKYVIRRQSSMN